MEGAPDGHGRWNHPGGNGGRPQHCWLAHQSPTIGIAIHVDACARLVREFGSPIRPDSEDMHIAWFLCNGRRARPGCTWPASVCQLLQGLGFNPDLVVSCACTLRAHPRRGHWLPGRRCTAWPWAASHLWPWRFCAACGLCSRCHGGSTHGTNQWVSVGRRAGTQACLRASSAWPTLGSSFPSPLPAGGRAT